MIDARRYAPAALRNRDAILDVLRGRLAPGARVLEIASGSGEHAVHFAAALPDRVFQPSDPDAAGRASIDAWAAAAGLRNILPALALDATAPDWPIPAWPIQAADLVLCVNMIHIAPPAATLGLIRNAARVLAPGGTLLLYGPFRRAGRHTAPGNAAFDQDLRRRNPDWGVRNLETVAAQAASAGFAAPEVVAMPANNLSVLFRKNAGAMATPGAETSRA